MDENNIICTFDNVIFYPYFTVVIWTCMIILRLHNTAYEAKFLYLPPCHKRRKAVSELWNQFARQGTKKRTKHHLNEHHLLLLGCLIMSCLNTTDDKSAQIYLFIFLFLVECFICWKDWMKWLRCIQGVNGPEYELSSNWMTNWNTLNDYAPY